MSLGITVDLRDAATPALARVREAFTRGSVRRVMGRAIQARLVSHFNDLAAARHRPSVSLNFYRSAAKATGARAPIVEAGAVKIEVPQIGIAQRYFGGRIVAGAGGSAKKWLTIPAYGGPAEGRRAAEFTGLKFTYLGRNKRGEEVAALITTDERERVELAGRPGATKRRFLKLPERGAGKLPVVFWLKRAVTQAPDKSVLPSEADILAAAAAGAEEFLAAELAKGGQP